MTPAAYGSAPSPSPSRAKAASGLPGEAVLAQIGDTPLLPLDALTRDLPSVKLLGKAEWHNPGGSVKDRTAASIVAAARRPTLAPQESARFHQPPPPHRPPHSRRRPPIPRHPLRAGECFSRAKAH